MLTPYTFLQFQIEHYSELIANAKTLEARIFLSKQLYGFKQRLQSLLN